MPDKCTYIFTILLISLISCSKKYESRTYYPNGNIKEIYSFKDSKAKKLNTDFKLTKYNESGTIMFKENRIDGKLNGEFVGYFPNGKPEYIASFFNGKKNGVSKLLSENNELINEWLHFNGEEIIRVVPTVIDDSTRKHDYFFMRDSSTTGTLYWQNNTIIKNKTLHYILEMPDTLALGTQYTIRLDFITFGIPHKILDAKFSEFQPSLKFPKEKLYPYDIMDDSKIAISLPASRIGRNALLGLVHIVNKNDSNEMNRKFVIYKDFYVEN